MKAEVIKFVQKIFIASGVSAFFIFNAPPQSLAQRGTQIDYMKGNFSTKGEYIVCPNGKTVKGDLLPYWNDYPRMNLKNPLSRPVIWEYISDINAEVIVGRTPNNYPKGELWRLKEKIMQGIDVTSYRMTGVEEAYVKPSGISTISSIRLT